MDLQKINKTTKNRIKKTTMEQMSNTTDLAIVKGLWMEKFKMFVNGSNLAVSSRPPHNRHRDWNLFESYLALWKSVTDDTKCPLTLTVKQEAPGPLHASFNMLNKCLIHSFLITDREEPCWQGRKNISQGTV